MSGGADLTTLVLLFIVSIFMLLSTYLSDKKNFKSEDYYSQYQSIKSYILFAILAILLLVVILDRLINRK